MSLIKAEFHVHTRYSKDSILNAFFILIMCKLKDIKLLAITDHNEIKGAIKYKKTLERHGIKVIIGEEIMTQSGEIIGLFLKEKIDQGLSVEDTINKIKSQSGIVYLPHPYDEKRYKTVLDYEKQKMLKNKIDFIETHNGRNISEDYDRKQEEIQKKLGISPIIGSDAHTFFEIGRNYIYVDYNTEEDFKNNIKSIIKTDNFKSKKCLMIAHTITKFARIIKLIETGDFDGLYRTIFKRSRR